MMRALNRVAAAVRAVILLLGLGLVALPVLASDAAPAQRSAATAASAPVGATRTLRRMIDGFSAEGTTASAWWAGRQLLRIEVEALGERGRVLFDFDWHQGRLVTARERRIDYGAPITALPADTPTPMNVVQDEQVHWQMGRLQAWTLNEQPQTLGTAQARARSDELRKVAERFRREMNGPPRPGDVTKSVTPAVQRPDQAR